jgi:hypothetical protein
MWWVVAVGQIFIQVLQFSSVGIIWLLLDSHWSLIDAIYCIYLNARQSFSVKFGTSMCEVTVNSCVRRWTRSLWTGPCRAKQRHELANCHMRSAVFWDITQHGGVIPYQCFGTTYQPHLQKWRNPKQKLKLTDTIFFLSLFTLSSFLRKHDILETAALSVFKQRST